MSDIRIFSNIRLFTSVAVAAILAGAACADAGQGGGGGGGGGHGGGGGGGNYGGGGMPYATGGGRSGGEMDMRGGPQYGGGMDMRGMPQYGGGMDMRGTSHYGGAARYAGHSAVSRFAARANSARHYSAVHGRPEFNGHRDVQVGRNHNAPTVGSNRSANAVRNASHFGAAAGAQHNTTNLLFPNARAQIVEGRGEHGWWRHRHGGFGWAGALFWPFAYHDIYDFTLWGYGYDDPFWDYGYGDIYAGIFTPSGYDDPAAYRRQEPGRDGAPQVNARPHVAAQPPVAVNAQPHVAVDPPHRVAANPPSRVAVNPPPPVAVDPPPPVAVDPPPPVAVNPPPPVAANPPPRVAVNPPPPVAVNPPPRVALNAQPHDSATAQPHAVVNAQPHDGVNPRVRGPQAAAPDQLTQMCGEDSRDIAGLPIDRIQAAIVPNDVQRAALDDLANASVKAAETIRAACPTEVALTAPGRVASMGLRIEAMISAVDTIQPALQKFTGLLDEGQKRRLNAVGNEQRGARAAKNQNGALTGSCDPARAKVTALPSAEIEAKIHPTEAQRKNLVALRDAMASAAVMLNVPCPPSAQIVTPQARLDAVRKRLDVTQQAIKIVLAALDDFYDELSEEQKAQFEAIGQRLSATSDQPSSARTRVRRPDAS